MSHTASSNDSVHVALLHSPQHTDLIYSTMKGIHKDRDILLASLLRCCGFILQTPKFFQVVAPRIASRRQIESFHSSDYLDLLEFHQPSSSGFRSVDEQSSNMNGNPQNFPSAVNDAAYVNLLDAYGLTDDCPIPANPRDRAQLWTYCRSVAGASLQAARLLLDKDASVHVAINWSGGRHHAHTDRAGGFCYINDAVLAMQSLVKAKRRVLYIDVDIHHADGVQEFFYDTDEVMTVSLHRFAAGFFPSKTGSIHEKGLHQSKGVGFNLNIPLPRGVQDGDFLEMIDLVIDKILKEYDPDVVVLCVGADGLRGDDLIKDTNEGWNLSPEAMAECVRRIAAVCGGKDYRMNAVGNKTLERRKLMILGGGGYSPINTARAFLLCTAAACEGIRPGMLWKELPKDVPHHEHFDRYGPSFQLYRNFDGNYYEPTGYGIVQNNDYTETIRQGKEAVNLSHLFLSKRKAEARKQSAKEIFVCDDEEISWLVDERNQKLQVLTSNGQKPGRRRKKFRV